jgi:antitoxin component of MazEF toxin-antitoxin module
MGEGIFFRSDKRAVAFRSWAEEVDAYNEKLPQNTFMDRTQTATTGAGARVVVIDKPDEKNDENVISIDSFSVTKDDLIELCKKADAENKIILAEVDDDLVSLYEQFGFKIKE